MYTNYMLYLEFFLVVFSFLFLSFYFFHKNNGLPTDWPLVRMLPALLKNLPRLHDCIVEVMERSQLTFLFKGPWFTNMNLLATVDPANAHHILSKNFGNYPKGSKFREIFEILGDGIFNTDSEIWQYHRKMAQSVLARPQFHQFLVEKTWGKIQTALVPILDHACKQGLEVDLQDLFGRFAFDTINALMIDNDPQSLSIDMPDLPFSKALHDAEEAIVHRYVVPTCIWKFQRWLGIGHEKKYREAWKIIDDFIYECISRKREEMRKNSQSRQAHKVGNELGVDLITLYMDEVGDNAEIGSNDDKFLRDTILAFLSAGKDTTSAALSWFFYLLSRNPHVLSKIKEELDAHKLIWQQYTTLPKNFDELTDKLIYLHASICEGLRLYPPVAFNAKAPIETDILPSGHQVDSSMQIIFSMYAMGRMKSLWGEDCDEFKPERWILETGKIRYVPSYKLLAFNSGPRTCVGKNISLTMMKAVVIAIVSKYRIEPIEGHPVVPNMSFVLHMKYGFMVNVVSY